MVSNPYRSYNITDRSYFSLMKKEIHALAEQNGFPVKKTAEIDIIVAEMASNLIKHGGGGEILVRVMPHGDPGNEVLELVSIDNGPGMQDAQKMMGDGISSTGTLGHGLGSINRLSGFFQIYSLKDWGTILVSRIGKKDTYTFPKTENIELRSLLVCKPGEEVCGDGLACQQTPGYFRFFLGDGLGHGKEANIAVITAARSFLASMEKDPVEMVRQMSADVKRTRGLVASAAVFSVRDKRWGICGVGNIATRIISNMGTRTYMAYNGIVGMNLPGTMKPQVVPYELGQVIVMCSDGIRTRWDMSRYTGILKYDLAILAAAIYKDHARRTDDMSVAVCRINKMI